MQIECGFYNTKFKIWDQYEIDLDMNIWPCCHIYLQHLEFGKVDECISHIDNNLRTNTIENIRNEFSKVLNEENWKDDKTCPPRCIKICQKK